jgi:hypothetical protein
MSTALAPLIGESECSHAVNNFDIAKAKTQSESPKRSKACLGGGN